MGDKKHKEQTAGQESLIKLTNFYFSPQKLYTHRSMNGGGGGCFVSGKCTSSQEQDIDWVNSSAGRSEQNGLLGTHPQDL